MVGSAVVDDKQCIYRNKPRVTYNNPTCGLNSFHGEDGVHLVSPPPCSEFWFTLHISAQTELLKLNSALSLLGRDSSSQHVAAEAAGRSCSGVMCFMVLRLIVGQSCSPTNHNGGHISTGNVNIVKSCFCLFVSWDDLTANLVTFSFCELFLHPPVIIPQKILKSAGKLSSWERNSPKIIPYKQIKVWKTGFPYPVIIYSWFPLTWSICWIKTSFLY